MAYFIDNNGSRRLYTDLRSKIVAVTEREKHSKSIIERKAYAEAVYFLINKVCIDEKDIFAGKLERSNINIAGMYPAGIKDEMDYLIETDNRNEKYKCMVTAEEMGLFTRSPGGHVVPAYDQLIKDGIQSTVDKIQFCIKNCEIKKKSFYTSELIVLRAMQERIVKYAKKAEQKYQISGNRNLRRIQDACRRIAFMPPQSFFEALQLILLAHEHILAEAGSGSISFGRFDQYLYPYYQKDLDTGKITPKEAREMIIAFWKKIAEYEMGWQNITLGGSDQNGKDMCNDLTIFCMDASLAVRADQPQISLRVHKNMPDNVWDKAFELIQTGMGFPELYNDAVAVRAKINAGIKEKDAWDYSIVGCVELTAGGKEYSHTEGARLNWQKILELMLNEGKCQMTGLNWELAEKHALDEFLDFQQFYDWYKRELRHLTKYICNFINVLSCQYGNYWPVPFLSSMMQGCIEKGKDVTNYGTVYNNLTLDCVGIATVADSLEAIETLVFKEKKIRLKELAAALNANFRDCESLRQKMLVCPKYGNDILSVDNKVRELTQVFTDTLSEQSVYGGGVYQAGFYTSYFHAAMGKQTGASSDGRMAGEALSPSLSPTAGMDRNGPTSVINSAVHINMEYFGNGMVLDLKLLASFFRQKKYRNAIRILIEEYFSMGGMEIQFNTLDRETLLEAQQNPFKYRNLVVRVSGFSAYFVTLEKPLQDEIIKRTEHQTA